MSPDDDDGDDDLWVLTDITAEQFHAAAINAYHEGDLREFHYTVSSLPGPGEALSILFICCPVDEEDEEENTDVTQKRSPDKF